MIAVVTTESMGVTPLGIAQVYMIACVYDHLQHFLNVQVE